jgi:hypothetical protein
LEEALIWKRRSVDANKFYGLSHFFLASTLAHLGRMEEAKSEVAAGLAVAPSFGIAVLRACAYSDNPSYLAQRERIIDGMRKAGVPEG